MLLIDTMLGNDDLEEKEEMKNALVKQIAKKKKQLRRPRITSCKNILTGHRGIKIWIEQRQCPLYIKLLSYIKYIVSILYINRFIIVKCKYN